jgi:hypothetical protein
VRAAIPAAVCALLLAAVGSAAVHLWRELDGASLGLHGYLALGLGAGVSPLVGAGVSLLVGMGLMTLIFISARRSYDDRVGGRDPGPTRPDPER